MADRMDKTGKAETERRATAAGRPLRDMLRHTHIAAAPVRAFHCFPFPDGLG